MPLIRLPRPLAATVTVIALAISCAGFLTACSGSSNENKPDLLLVIVDDQRADTMEVVPAVRASFPVVFRNGFATTPNCCPSRSSILSGEYAHTTGVKHNGYLEVWQDREEDTLGPWLQEQGYYTGFVGKYFNQYSRDDYIPVGWDEFYGLAYDVGDRIRTVGLREGFRDAEGDEHDELAVYPDAEHPALYPTTIFSRLAERFLDHAASEAFNPDGKPFALVLSTTVPNTRRIPPRYAHAPLPPWHQPPSFMEPDMSDKPLEIRESHRVVTKPSQAAAVRARQLRELMTVNDAIKAVWARIARYGWRRHTWGIYFSDNGRFWGEHHLRKKYAGYEEAIHVPFRMAVPGLGRRSFDELVANIDIAPTLVDLAGDDSDHDFAGRSLVPIIRGETQSRRKDLLIEHWSVGYHYRGLRTRRWAYIHWIPTGHEELYDLRADPYELRNIAATHPLTTARLLRRVRALASG